MKTNIIYNEDCLEGLKRLPDNSVDLVLTDPPYNASNSNIKCKKKSYNSINEKWDKNFKINNFSLEFYRILKKSSSLLIFCSHHTIKDFLIEFDTKFRLQQIIHWEKSNAFPGLAKVYTYSIQYCLWYIKNNPYKFNKKYAKKDIIKIPICCGHERLNHPAQKPINLFSKLLKVHSNENDVILDPFMGSGTTAIACLELNRKYIGFEIDEEYYKLAQERIDIYNSQLKLPLGGS